MNIIKSTVISLAVQAYAIETWKLKKDGDRLLAFEMKCYRRILGIRWEQKITNEEVQRIVRCKQWRTEQNAARLHLVINHKIVLLQAHLHLYIITNYYYCKNTLSSFHSIFFRPLCGSDFLFVEVPPPVLEMPPHFGSASPLGSAARGDTPPLPLCTPLDARRTRQAYNRSWKES